MPSNQPSFIQSLWAKWKGLRFPWRRHVLIGNDLAGNTYWEFRIAGQSRMSRPRRKVYYPRSTHHSDVKVPPLWHQWLRYTRQDPPTSEEQVAEEARKERIKILAAEADARWEAKPRLAGEESIKKAVKAPCRADGGNAEQRNQDKNDDQKRVVAGDAKPNPWEGWERARETSAKWEPVAWSAGPKPKP